MGRKVFQLQFSIKLLKTVFNKIKRKVILLFFFAVKKIRDGKLNYQIGSCKLRANIDV